MIPGLFTIAPIIGGNLHPVKGELLAVIHEMFTEARAGNDELGKGGSCPRLPPIDETFKAQHRFFDVVYARGVGATDETFAAFAEGCPGHDCDLFFF